jgi:hypothetical protein
MGAPLLDLIRLGRETKHPQGCVGIEGVSCFLEACTWPVGGLNKVSAEPGSLSAPPGLEKGGRGRSQRNMLYSAGTPYKILHLPFKS